MSRRLVQRNTDKLVADFGTQRLQFVLGQVDRTLLPANEGPMVSTT